MFLKSYKRWRLIRIPLRYKGQSNKLKEFVDYYEVLGVEKDATTSEIKASYFNLARKYHPDINPDPEAKVKFEQIMKAYEVLSDHESRDAYDGKSKTGFFSRFSSFFDEARLKNELSIDEVEKGYKDSFNEEFNKFKKFYDIYNPRLSVTHKGTNILVVAGLDFNEAFKGCFRQVEVLRYIVCSGCKGKAGKPGHGATQCYSCGGHGKVDYKMDSMILCKD